MKRFAMLFSARATREIDDAARRWARRGSPTCVDDAVGAVLSRLERFPYMAPRMQIAGKWSTTRPALVDPLGYHRSYRVNEQAETILVRCFWSARRPPPRL